MTDSILSSTKKALGLAESDTAFDVDVLMHINSALSILNQLGVGPSQGFMVEDKDAVWSDFLQSDLRFNMVKTYVYLKVRLAFDLPQNSFTVKAMEDQVKELEWRINVHREEEGWQDPNPPVLVPDE